MPNPYPVLTSQQLAFCAAYVRLRNATQAAAEAGYKHPNKLGDQLMRKPLVKKEIARLGELEQQTRDKKTIADAHEVQEQLTTIMRDVKNAAKDRVSAARELARILGIAKEGRVLTGPNGGPIQLEKYDGMSTAELKEKARTMLGSET